MIVESTRGFGKVKNPLTGDDIDVQDPFETDRETFEALDKRYPGFQIVSESDNPKGSGGEDDPEICGTEMTDGSECERPAGECPYHD